MASLGFLTKVLPWISAAATCNIPALVGLASGVIGTALGKPVASTTDAIAEAVAGATPEQMIALKTAENDFAAKMQSMGFAHQEDLEKIAADDRASARVRETTLRDKLPSILALFITVGLFGLLATMLKVTIPPDNEKLMDIMLGALTTGWVSVVSYYFGSSAAHDAMTSAKK